MSAPEFRSVDALSGDVASSPSKFWVANANADEHLRNDAFLLRRCEELQDHNAELLCRIDELQGEDDAKAETIGRLKAERDALAQQLATANAASSRGREL